MSTTISNLERLRVISFDEDDHSADFARDVRTGLTAPRKRLSPVHFYDHAGSLLFERICELPEYYLTRAETEILRDQKAVIGSRLRSPFDLVELGSGNSAKTRLLIEHFLTLGGGLTYYPVDISAKMLEQSSIALLADYEELEIVCVAADYHTGLKSLQNRDFHRRLILWLGSSIGNLGRAEAASFLGKVVESLNPDDRLLIGIDLRKDRDVLERAYNDSRGVTAEFNRNILSRINRELGGDFDVRKFCHRAVYDEVEGRVSMYLVSSEAQKVRISSLGLEILFAPGEDIHTENSYKYSLEEIDRLAADTGISLVDRWLHRERLFSLNLFQPGRESV